MKGVCYCSRCMRQDQITKLKALNMSLGGLDRQWPEEENPLDQFAAENIDNTERILAVPEPKTKEEKERKLIKTFRYLGFLPEEEQVDGANGADVNEEDTH